MYRTYKGTDGYAPMAGYISAEGYCLAMELHEGSQDCQKDTPKFLVRYLERASQVPEQPLLLRLDCGNDSLDNVDVVIEHNEAKPEHGGVDFLIKWNPRCEDQLQWYEYAIENAYYEQPREGKRVWVFCIDHQRTRNGYDYTIRRVMRVIERSIDKRGQSLLVPEAVVEGWWTSLTLDVQMIIDLYSDHGTSEQFYSEFKSDLDIE